MNLVLEIVNDKGLHARASAKFVETVERVVPGPAEQREIIESWMHTAQSLISKQSDALRGILRDAIVVNVNVDTGVNVDPKVRVKVPTTVTVP